MCSSDLVAFLFEWAGVSKIFFILLGNMIVNAKSVSPESKPMNPWSDDQVTSLLLCLLSNRTRQRWGETYSMNSKSR